MINEAGAVPSVAWLIGVHLVVSFTSDFLWYCLTSQGSPAATQHVASVESSSYSLWYFSRLNWFTVMIH